MSQSEAPRERESKKRKTGDRVELDVGGQKFISAISTLTNESTYFRSKFSEHWQNDEPCFVDQDPSSFAILLDYMRSGMIRVKDITQGILAQAVFLGMDSLLTAVKVRAYRNLRPRDESTSEEEASKGFDEEYGGMLGAISSGVLPDALSLEPEPRKEYASINVPCGGAPNADFLIARITTSANNETDLITTGGSEITLLGALNKLAFYGFTTYEASMLQEDRWFTVFTFSRRVPKKQDESTKVFVDCGSLSASRTEAKKSFALMIDNTEGHSLILYAPKNFIGDNESNKWSSQERNKDLAWLVERSYDQREEELESIFSGILKEFTDDTFEDSQEIHRRARIFSRPL